ncbi:penicillin-binding protein 2 [Hahella sp. SMD15-11]|uniref:Peptidoglycan D,D-transpeptidase MrdA n=1 Tax=Thermohahella caldifontis TaxID=3142973 RepID=A0AB39UWJ5_9GAMM
MAVSELKDPRRERRIFLARAIVSVIVMLGCFAVLAWRYGYLQIEQHKVYRTLSDKNRMQLQSIPPTRGLILDRNGNLIADNQPTFSLLIVPEHVKDMSGLIDELGMLIELDEDDLESFEKRLRRRRRPYEGVAIRSRLTDEEIARIAVNRHRLKGVEISAELIRSYPYGDLFAHAVGYVGRINERELEKLDPADYDGTHYIGKTGVERFYEDLLHGDAGFQTVEKDARMQVLRVLDKTPPVPGKDLRLTLDVRLQQVAADALKGQRGAVVAIDPRDGGILALVSQPAFDPNWFVTGISTKRYSVLRDSLDLPLFNRATRGRYPPGSTIKPVIALAGLDTGVVTPEYRLWDPGWYQLEGDDRLYRDWKRGGHGWVDLNISLAESCDVYFYDLAYKLGVDRMAQYLAMFGIGSVTADDVVDASAGILPTREWKRAVRGRKWYHGDSLNMGIGQGFMVTTPLQLATMTAVLANRGKWVVPHLLQNAGDEVWTPREVHPDVSVKNPWAWSHVIKGMEAVMHDRHGTARRSALGAPYRMAGKTGTAQVVGIPQGEKYNKEELAERLQDHALFVGFAPLDDPKIAVAVVVENGGGGSTAAAPIARKLFDAWLLDRTPEELDGTEVAENRP